MHTKITYIDKHGSNRWTILSFSYIDDICSNGVGNEIVQIIMMGGTNIRLQYQLDEKEKEISEQMQKTNNLKFKY